MDGHFVACSPADLIGILEQLVALIICNCTTSMMSFSTKAQPQVSHYANATINTNSTVVPSPKHTARKAKIKQANFLNDKMHRLYFYFIFKVK